MKSRYKIIMACGVLVLLFLGLFGVYGYNNTWRLWNIPTMSPCFLDLRTITHGAETYAQGGDPMIKNPTDPLRRRLNYPRIWQSLYALGLNPSHTIPLGIGIICSFLIGVCLILPFASNIMIGFVVAALLSPAVLLGVERGNIDLLMFFFAAVSVVTVQRSSIGSSFVILTGFVLKLFPLFGCPVLLKAGRSKFLRSMIGIFAFVSLYGVITFSDIVLIREGTPRSTDWSYGMNVFWMNMMSSNRTLGVSVRILSYVSVLLIVMFAFSALYRRDHVARLPRDTLYLDAFRVGASIYIGTFLLGNNWDYRLTFLILTIPQLLVWTMDAVPRISTTSKLALVVIFLSLWYFVIIKLLGDLPYGRSMSFMLDELSNWVAFSALLYLLFWSTPAWVKDVVHKNLTVCVALVRRHEEK